MLETVMAQSPLERHLQVSATQAREALLTIFPSALEAFNALKTPQDKLIPFLAIKQLYTQHSMNPSVAFDLMSPFRGKKDIEMKEWVSVLQGEISGSGSMLTSEEPAVRDDREEPAQQDYSEEEAPEQFPELTESPRNEQSREESVHSQVSPLSSSRSFAREFAPSHVTKKSLTESVREIQLPHPKSSALRDKQKWMELARSDFLGIASERGSQKSSVTQIFSDIDYELYPEDIECMGLSEANRNLLAEELKKMAQVNKALRRL